MEIISEESSVNQDINWKHEKKAHKKVFQLQKSLGNENFEFLVFWVLQAYALVSFPSRGNFSVDSKDSNEDKNVIVHDLNRKIKAQLV